MRIDAFTRGYLEAALWTTDPYPTIGGGEWSEHDDWIVDNIAPESLACAIEDCAAFQAENADDLFNLESTDSRNGCDFWLTRNRHGAGFWDRGYGDAGKRLTDSAHIYGESNVSGPETEHNGSATDEQIEVWDKVIHID